MICYRCQHVGDTVPSKKIKRMSAEQSSKFQACAKCGCRTFYSEPQRKLKTIYNLAIEQALTGYVPGSRK